MKFPPQVNVKYWSRVDIASWLRCGSIVAPSVLTLLVPFFLAWVAWQVCVFSYTGFVIINDTVTWVDPSGPAHGLLQPNDRVLTLNGNANLFAARRQHYPINEPLTVKFMREGGTHTVRVLTAAPTIATILIREITLLVACAFWVIGSVVLFFGTNTTQSRLFWGFCTTLTIALSAASWSVYGGPAWADQLARVLIWWIGPFAIHFHRHFPQPTGTIVPRALIGISYLVAAGGSVLSLSYHPWTVQEHASLLYTLSLGWLTLCLFTLLPMLAWSYRRTSTSALRRPIRLVTLGACLAFAPFCLVVLIPTMLNSPPFFGYDEIGFPFLLALPLTYGYSIMTHGIISLDRYVSRGAAYGLVLTLIVGIYALLGTLAHQFFSPAILAHPAADLLRLLIIITLVGPLYRGLQHAVNRLLYGGSRDYRMAVQHINRTLDTCTDQENLAHTLSQTLHVALQLECAYLFLDKPTGGLMLAAVSGNGNVWGAELPQHIASDSPIYGMLQQHKQPLTGGTLAAQLTTCLISPIERTLLIARDQWVWVPLRISERLYGVFFLGPKLGRAFLNSDDHAVLALFARQAGILLHNRTLISELEQRNRERTMLHQQALRSREEERQAIARDLHDEIIQDLVQINYGLAALRPQFASDIGDKVSLLQTDLQRSLAEIRRICRNLRPAALDTLGLISAIRAHLSELDNRMSLQVQFQLVGDYEHRVPTDIELCLFRVVQETMSNVQKHAMATWVEVRLELQQTCARLTITDNGTGFQVPNPLGCLLDAQCFGLVGLRERVALVGGTLHIQSRPGHGTQIQVAMPLVAAASGQRTIAEGEHHLHEYTPASHD